MSEELDAYHAASRQLVEACVRHVHGAVSIILTYSLLDCTSFWLLPLKAPPLCLLMATLGRERARAPALCAGLTAFLGTAENPRSAGIPVAGNIPPLKTRYRQDF